MLAAQEEAQDLLETAQDGADSEDLKPVSEAAAAARKLAKKCELAVKAAKRAISTSAATAMDGAVPEHVLAMDAWASKYKSA